MRFEKRGGLVFFRDVRPGNHAMLMVDGQNLPARGDKSEHAFDRGEYAWAFEHSDVLHYGQRFVFRTDDREVVGEVIGGEIRVEPSVGFDVLLRASAPLALRRTPPVKMVSPGPSRPVPQSVDEMVSPGPSRLVAQSVDEIRVRHGVTGPALEPYAAAIVSGEGPVHATLDPALLRVRDGHEVVEVYVRLAAYAGLPPLRVYEPLCSRHLALNGEWVIVARKRHLNNEPRIVGIMLSKDEDDVANEVIPSLAQWLDALYFFAGDQATHDAIIKHAPEGWARAIPDPRLPHSDGLRHFLLEQARRDALTDCDPRPMWVISVQGDEVYRDDLRQHVMLAQNERATVMTCQVATFFLHESQREGWDWAQPLDRRLNHYIWDFGEHAGFLDFPWVYYDPSEHMRAHPHGIYPAKWATARPVRKHYPFRSPEQAWKRLEDRIKSGWQPHYENYRDVFMNGQAAGRPIKKYHGWFPEAERVPGMW